MKRGSLSGDSFSPRESIIDRLRSDLPEIFSDGRIDVEKLKVALWENTIAEERGYGFTWTGKKECFETIQAKTTKTLHPRRDESVDWDTTSNVFIEGDNLEALKILQRSYYGQIKMIYIDPPYNTGKDFIYSDKFAQARRDVLIAMGAIDEEGRVINAELYKQNTRDSGHYHSKWLSMMYPRLYLARNLLRQDGVIFVSIDDNEVHNLRKVMDEIFGEENFVGNLFVLNNLKWNYNTEYFADVWEHLLVYAKNKPQFTVNDISIEDDEEKNEWQMDHKWFWKKWRNIKGTWENAPREKRPTMFFPLYVSIERKEISLKKDEIFNIEVLPITNWKEMCWNWGKEQFEKNKNEVLVCISDNWTINIHKKQRPEIGDVISKKPKNLFYHPSYSNTVSAKIMEELFWFRIFDYSKSLLFIEHLLQVWTSSNDLILDFFAGSGTTAHAVMALNAEDGGNRRCISVQLPEICRDGTEAQKAGYATIADIARERIRRAGKKIAEENPGATFDRGFRAFRVDESHFKEWDPHIRDMAHLEQQLMEFANNIKPTATDEWILYEILLKIGQSPVPNMDRCEYAGIEYYRVGADRDIVLCLAHSGEYTLDFFDEILKTKTRKLITLDPGFPSDTCLMTNVELRCKQAGDVDFVIL